MSIMAKVPLRFASFLLAATGSLVEELIKGTDLATIIRIPRDIRTAVKWLDLDPDLETRVCCVKCFSLYPVSAYPANCTFKLAPRAKVCGEALAAISSKSIKKIRQEYQWVSFEAFFSNLIAFPGMEDILDVSIRPVGDPCPEIRRSIWDSPDWRSLLDTDGQPFTSKSGNIVMSIYIDWFKAGRSASGPAESLGIVKLAIENLPQHMKHHRSFEYPRAILCGPLEPSAEQVSKHV